MSVFDLLVIGAGPAGLGAAIQAAHAGLSAAVLEMRRPSSRLLLARRVENFPGQRGLVGPELLGNLRRQARARGVRMIPGRCLRLDYLKRRFGTNASEAIVEAKAVILATGLKPKGLGRNVAPAGLEGKKLFYRWTDIPRIGRKGAVLVIGGGETAFDQACSLAERGFEAAIVVRSGQDRAFDSLRREARGLDISVRYDTRVVGIGEDRGGLAVSMQSAGRVAEGRYDFCLVAIGGTRNVPDLSPVARRRLGAGIYLAGEAADPRWRQAAIAYGDGIKKAMMACEFLRAEGR